MKGCVLRVLLLLLAVGSLRAEQIPPTSASDTVFLWLAGGLSSARIQRLAQTQGDDHNACHATTQCTRALQKAGADAGLIQSLEHQNSDWNSMHRSDLKSAADQACSCSSPAAQVAALVHDKNFSSVEDKIRSMLREGGETASPNRALLHFVLGTVLRRQDQFEEALDEFAESSRLLPGFAESHNQLAYLF